MRATHPGANGSPPICEVAFSGAIEKIMGVTDSKGQREFKIWPRPFFVTAACACRRRQKESNCAYRRRTVRNC